MFKNNAIRASHPRASSPVGWALAAALLAGAAFPAHATIFPFSSGFSPSVNGTPSPWSYLQRDLSNLETPLTGANTVFHTWHTSYLTGTPGNTLGWDTPNVPNNIPVFFAHNNFQLWWVRGNCCGPVTLPAKSVFMHPGAGGIKAVLSFVVPPKATGASYRSARIKGQFTHVDCQGVPYGADGIIWSVEHNLSVVAGPTALNSTNCSALASSPVTPSFAVTTGDTIKFVVDANTNEQFDLTALAGAIDLN